MTNYARIADGVVAELIQLQPSDDVNDFFAPEFAAALVKLAGGQNGAVTIGWRYDGETFSSPPVEELVVPPTLTMEDLLAQIQAKQAELEALIAKLPAA